MFASSVFRSSIAPLRPCATTIPGFEGSYTSLRGVVIWVVLSSNNFLFVPDPDHALLKVEMEVWAWW